MAQRLPKDSGVPTRASRSRGSNSSLPDPPGTSESEEFARIAQEARDAALRAQQDTPVSEQVGEPTAGVSSEGLKSETKEAAPALAKPIASSSKGGPSTGSRSRSLPGPTMANIRHVRNICDDTADDLRTEIAVSQTVVTDQLNQLRGEFHSLTEVVRSSLGDLREELARQSAISRTAGCNARSPEQATHEADTAARNEGDSLPVRRGGPLWPAGMAVIPTRRKSRLESQAVASKTGGRRIKKEETESRSRRSGKNKEEKPSESRSRSSRRHSRRAPGRSKVREGSPPYEPEAVSVQSSSGHDS